jgi:hypothetical protein
VGKKLALEPSALAMLTDATIAEAAVELNLSLVDRAALEHYVSTVRAQRPTLADVAERAENLKLYTWKEAESRAIRLGGKFTEDFEAARAKGDDPFKPLLAHFESNARAGLLSPESSLVLSYVLYAQDSSFGRYMLASLLLYVPHDQRLPTHNWLLAQQLDSGMKHAVGAQIEQLRFPLFPPNAQGADTLNAKLMRGDPTALAVGHGRSSDGMYTADPLFTDGRTATGAGALPLQQLQDGSYAVDTAPIEHAFGAEIEKLRRDIQRLSSIAGRNRPPAQQPMYQQTGTYQQQPHNQRAPPVMPQQQQQQQQQLYQPPGPQQRQRQPRRPTGGSPALDPLQPPFATATPAPTTQPLPPTTGFAAPFVPPPPQRFP